MCWRPNSKPNLPGMLLKSDVRHKSLVFLKDCVYKLNRTFFASLKKYFMLQNIVKNLFK